MTETTELFSIEPEAIDAAALYTDRARFGELRKRIKGVIDDFEPDLSSEAGRGEIASLAYKIAKVKTKVDKTGKDLGDEARSHLNALNAARKEFREELEAMQTAVRAPLTEWEEAEKTRQAEVEAVFKFLNGAAMLHFGASSQTAIARIEQVEEMKLDGDVLGERLHEARDLRDQVLGQLGEQLRRIEAEERDRAELARLKREEEERLRREAEEANRKAAEATRAEAARMAAEQERADLIEREAAEGPEPEASRDYPTAPRTSGPSPAVTAAVGAICRIVPIEANDAAEIIRAIRVGRIPGVKWEG